MWPRLEGLLSASVVLRGAPSIARATALEYAVVSSEKSMYESRDEMCDWTATATSFDVHSDHSVLLSYAHTSSDSSPR